MKLCFCISLLIALESFPCAKILGVFPFGSKSHYAIGEATMRALHEAGHEVTMISVFELKKPLENYHQIKLKDMMDDKPFNPFDIAKLHGFFSLFFLFGMAAKQVDHVMSSEPVQSLLKSKEKFDAVVVEIFAIDALLGFGQHFDCPVIGVNSFDGVYWNDVYTGNQSPYSFVPMPFLGYTNRMSFPQRLANTIFSIGEKFLYNFHHLPTQKKLYEKYFPSARKNFNEVHTDISIVFMNSHVSSSSARPLMPNMIEINGIHVQSAKSLPEDIKKFLDSATAGALVFTMGSFVKSTDWTVEQREAFVSVFGKLKQKVIWKYENETLPGNPGNILIKDWLPQRDILAHPNVKLFITHGGNLGTTEALSEGVPLLGLPLFGDQQMNINRAVEKGYALTLNYLKINEQNLGEAVNELLTNPKFKENAKKFSRISQDRTMSPKQYVVYWTEYVIRHQGANHLKAVGRQLSSIELHLIDVYATLTIGMFVFFLIVLKIFRLIFRGKQIKEKKLGKNKKKQ